MPQYKDFSDTQTQQELQSKLAGKEYSNVRRMAGLGIHTVASGDLDVNVLVDQIAANPDTVWCCIDEHSGADHKPGTLCPHTGCGAAEGIHGAIMSGNKTVIDNLNNIMPDAVTAVINKQMSPDELGVAWAKALQVLLEKKGVKMNISPVGIERFMHHGHPIHSATGIQVNMMPEDQSNFLVGKPEEKPFFYTNTDKEMSPLAVMIAAREAALASAIAASGHGLGKELKSFTIMISGLPEDRRDEFKSEAEKYHAAFKSEAQIQFLFQ